MPPAPQTAERFREMALGFPSPLPQTSTFRLRPLPVVTLLFVSGILIAAQASPLFPILPVLLCLLLALALVTRRGLWLQGSALICFVLLGAIRYSVASAPNPHDISQLTLSLVTLTGVVESDVELPADSSSSHFPTARCLLAVQRVDAVGAVVRQAAASGIVSLRLPLPESDVGDLPRYGDLLDVHGRLERPQGPRNPGGFDEADQMARQGISTLLILRSPQDWHIVKPQAGDNPLRSIAFGLRQGLIRQLRLGLSREHAAVMEGLLLGSRGDLPGDLNDAFERIGATHLLATAGLHIGFVAVLLAFGLRLARLPRRPALLATMLLLLLYAVMAGWRPSVVRAVLMTDLFLLGAVIEREPDLTNSISLAALILLLLDPRSLFDSGFQFSFAVMITILLLMPQAEETLRHLGERIPQTWPGANWIRRAVQFPVACFFLSLASQIGAAPLTTTYYNQLSLVALFANTLLVPPAALLIGLGLITAALGALHLPFVWLLYHLLTTLLTLVIFLARACSAPSWASLSALSPPVWFVIGYYAVVWGVAWRWSGEGIANQRKDAPSTHSQDSEPRSGR